jgi:hypothetical protein
MARKKKQTALRKAHRDIEERDALLEDNEALLHYLRFTGSRMRTVLFWYVRRFGAPPPSSRVPPPTHLPPYPEGSRIEGYLGVRSSYPCGNHNEGWPGNHCPNRVPHHKAWCERCKQLRTILDESEDEALGCFYSSDDTSDNDDDGKRFEVTL